MILFYQKIRPEVHSNVPTQRHVTNQPRRVHTGSFKPQPVSGWAGIDRVNPTNAGPL